MIRNKTAEQAQTEEWSSNSVFASFIIVVYELLSKTFGFATVTMLIFYFIFFSVQILFSLCRCSVQCVFRLLWPIQQDAKFSSTFLYPVRCIPGNILPEDLWDFFLPFSLRFGHSFFAIVVITSREVLCLCIYCRHHTALRLYEKGFKDF